jgi:hypothetical protein
MIGKSQCHLESHGLLVEVPESKKEVDESNEVVRLSMLE